MDWLKKMLERIQVVWKDWKSFQKVIFLLIVVAVVIGLILLITFSAKPASATVFSVAVTDEAQLNKIVMRLEKENFPYSVGADGLVYMESESDARQARSILFREGLVPDNASPWDVFNMDRWTADDFDDNVNFQKALKESIQIHIEALDDIDRAQVEITFPKDELFTERQNDVKASVVVTPAPGSDFTENKKKIKGLVNLLLFAVDGLNEENLKITDNRSVLLNDFTGEADNDRLQLAQRMLREKRSYEDQFKNQIFSGLKDIFTDGRISIQNIDVELEFDDRKTVEKKLPPIVMQEDDPSTPYSELKVEAHVLTSEMGIDEVFEGTGFNPEGPPDMEGSTPPAYKDLNGQAGSYSNKQQQRNYEVQETTVEQQDNPYQIKRVSIAVAIDGTWKWEYDEKGNVLFETDGSIKRVYTPVSEGDLATAQDLVEKAIGFNEKRQDAVAVNHISFDRTEQFKKEDSVFKRRQNLQKILIYSIIALASIFALFIAYRVISKEVEKRRRLREEELARQHQAMREQALRNAEEEGMEVEMSVEHRARQEAQENAKSLTREHPEAVAQLIRTWMAED